MADTSLRCYPLGTFPTDKHFLRHTRLIPYMGFHYRLSRGDRVQIISGKHKGATEIPLSTMPS